MSQNERSKPDLRVLIFTEREKQDYGYGPTFRVKADVVHIDPTKGVEHDVRTPRFSYEADGIGEYEGLTLTAHIGASKGVVDAERLYVHGVSYRDLYGTVELPRAEAMVKVLRRVGKHFERLDGRFGGTDFAGMCARLADALGATATYPLGVYSRDEMFANGTHYRWMGTDSLRHHIDKEIAAWMEANHLTKREAA